MYRGIEEESNIRKVSKMSDKERKNNYKIFLFIFLFD